jgi:hypothetical protein
MANEVYNFRQMHNSERDNVKMNKSILKNIIDGMMNVLVLQSDNDYIRPDKCDFSRDAANLRSDFNHVASDLRKTTLKYGENYNR